MTFGPDFGAGVVTVVSGPDFNATKPCLLKMGPPNIFSHQCTKTYHEFSIASYNYIRDDHGNGISKGNGNPMGKSHGNGN